MIRAEKLSYSFPGKDLYEKVSFQIEEGRHCAFIGTNGTGKSTLVSMILHPDDYLYDGKLIVDRSQHIGYVSQFSQFGKQAEATVFDYISEPFVQKQAKINEICETMAEAEDMDAAFEAYQAALDAFDALDGNNYESNIMKQLKVAGITKLETIQMTALSGGECKLVQVIREMMLSPKLLIMDEPDGFLDFDHLNGLKALINQFKGTLLVITHNRFLLHHCFNQILHLENTQIQSFEGNYEAYTMEMLARKAELLEKAAIDTAEIERNEKLVGKLRNSATLIDSATKGRTLKARVSLLKRLEARRTKEPFIDIWEPEIELVTEAPLEAETDVVTLADYSVSFGEQLFEHVNLAVQAGEKVAVVGPNGTGKTTLLRDLFAQEKASVQIAPEVHLSYLSQVPGETVDETATIREEMAAIGFEKDADMSDYLLLYGFPEDYLDCRVGTLSGGEKNLLQLAKIAAHTGNLLLLDEPSSHLDLYAQDALEDALNAYNGTIIMVSHDFYTIANCMDYVLLIEEKGFRKVSIRKFRKMIYADYFDKDYLEKSQQRQQYENKIKQAMKAGNFELAKKLLEEKK